MAQGSSTSSSDASMKTNASSASQVSAAKKVKFRTTSPELCARNSRSSRIRTARANPCPVVGTKVVDSKQNHGKSPATVANNAGSCISLLPESVHHGNKRNLSRRNVATPTRRKDVKNSTVTPTSYLTNNKNKNNSINANSTSCRTRNCITSSSCPSDIGKASTSNCLNTRSNRKGLKSKQSIISTCIKTGLSRNSITTTVDNSNNNTISIINPSGLGSSNRIASSIINKNDIAAHTNLPRSNDYNGFHSLNNSHCSANSLTNLMASSCTMSISSSITVDSPATCNLQRRIVNGSADTNGLQHQSDGKMCKEAHDLVELPRVKEMRPEFGEFGSQSSEKVEVNSESPEKADGIDKKHKSSVPEELKDVSATHQMACNSTKSSEQCGSLSRLAVFGSTIDMMPDEDVSTMQAEKSSGCCEVSPTSTPEKSLLLFHQQRQQETCLHCGTAVEFILSHLVHSRRCQSSYDLDTLEQVARRRSNGGASLLSHLPSLQTLDTIPSVGASVEVANDLSFQQEENKNGIQVEADVVDDDIEGRKKHVYLEQSDFDLNEKRTDECDDFNEPYFLSEDNPPNDGRNHQLSLNTNNNSAPWQPSSVKVEYGLPTTVTSRTVARKVKELSKASVMARKVLKTPTSQPDETLDLVNLVRLHSKGGVPIVMRKRKKTIQEEIEEEEMEERRRRPVITARIPVNLKFYHRRSVASNSASDEDNSQHCEMNHTDAAESIRNKKRVPRLRDSNSLNEVSFSGTVQTTGHGVKTPPPHIAIDKPPDVWNKDLLLMQQKLLDFQKRLKVCERLSQTTLEEGNDSDTNKRDSGNGVLKNAPCKSDVFSKQDRLSGSIDAEHLEETGSGRDFFEATEDWFIPEKFQADRQRKEARDDMRTDSKFGVKRKIVTHHMNKELSDTMIEGHSFNNNENNDDIGNTPVKVDDLTNNNEDIEEMPDYFDEDFLKQHFKMRSSKDQKRYSSPALFSPPARGRRIHIKRTECKSCGAKIKYILSHLSKSFKCQALYDMTLLRAQSEQNRKLRQRHYERQHKSIIKERQRQYYHDKREALRNNKRLYYQQNKDTYRERQSQYYFKHYDQQRERKRLYYIQNSERIREKHRRYNTVYRQREWNKRLQLDLLHYRREMVERGEDPDASEQVVEMTQHIMALPTDIEGIKKAMVAAGTFCGDDDEGMLKGRITIDSWRRNARAWVGGRRLLEAGKAGVLAPGQHVPNAKRGVARVKRLGNSKVIKLTKAGDATGVAMDDDGRGGGSGDDFMMAADQVIIEAVGDLALGVEIKHDIEYVADGGDDASLVEEIYIQEERNLLPHSVGPDDDRHQPVEEEVASVGEVQTEIHEDHNQVSFVQTLVEGESFYLHDENEIDQLEDGTISFGLGVGTLKRRRPRHNQRGSQPRRTLNAKRASFKFSYRTTNEDNLSETEVYQTTNEDNLSETDVYQTTNEDNLSETDVYQTTNEDNMSETDVYQTTNEDNMSETDVYQTTNDHDTRKLN